MNTTKKSIAVLTAALAALAFTSVGTVSASETKGATLNATTLVETSTTPNKLFHDRRGFYDRQNDVWVYFAK